MLFDLKFCAIDTFTRHLYIAQEQALNFNSSFQGQLDDWFWPNCKRFFPRNILITIFWASAKINSSFTPVPHFWLKKCLIYGSYTNDIQQFKFKSYNCRFFGGVVSKYKDESQIPAPLGLGLDAGHELDRARLVWMGLAK